MYGVVFLHWYFLGVLFCIFDGLSIVLDMLLRLRISIEEGHGDVFLWEPVFYAWTSLYVGALKGSRNTRRC